MSKTILVKLKKAGNNATNFSIADNYGNILATNVSKEALIEGIAYIVEDEVTVIILTYSGKDCCNKTLNIPVSTITKQEVADITFSTKNTSSMWSHLTDITKYNEYYGCIHSYIIEYPFAYQYLDEIVQNVKDYTKVYKYLPKETTSNDSNRKIQTNDKYFNKAILYNDQQSSGTLNLYPKPFRDMKAYLSYPKFNADSKDILVTKSDNFYQYNTFWNIVKDAEIPLFTSSCEGVFLDKEVNQDNMDYSTRAFRKATIRAKDLKVRQILDNSSSVNLVSQFIITPAQLSYK